MSELYTPDNIEDFHKEAQQKALEIIKGFLINKYDPRFSGMIICECMSVFMALNLEDYERAKQSFTQYLENPRLKEWVNIVNEIMREALKKGS